MSWIKKLRRRFKFTGTNEPKLAPPAQAHAKRVVNPSPVAKSNQKKREHIDKTKYRAHFEGLVDIVENEGKSAFLVKNGSKLETLNKIELDGQIYFPPPIDKIPFQLIPALEIIKNYKSVGSLLNSGNGYNLYDKIKKYLYSVSDLGCDEYYDLCATWIMHTYRHEATHFFPILWLFAIPDRGKTRTGKGMIFASYRGMHVESLAQAYILRASRDVLASLFIDVFDIWKKAMRSEATDILLHRFKKGSTVPRVLWPDKGPFKDTEYFTVSGPTIIGSNRGGDFTLESRSIQIVMPETKRKFEGHVTPESAMSLRTQLEVYRTCFLNRPFPKMNKPFLGRFGDITVPLCQVVREIAPKREESLLKVLKELEEQRLTSKSETFEAIVLTAIVKLSTEVRNNHLSIKSITEEINDERGERNRLTPQKIGRVIKSLGFSAKRTEKSGGTSLIWEPEILNSLLFKHGMQKIPETSETSEDITSKTEDSEDSEGLALTF